MVVGPRPSQPRWRSLARGAIGPQPSGPKQSGGRRQTAFLSREECRRLAAGEKSRRSRCGKAIEAKPALGPDPSIRGCVRTRPSSRPMKTTKTIAVVTTRTWQRRSRKDVLPRINGRQRRDRQEQQRIDFVLQHRRRCAHERRPAGLRTQSPCQGRSNHPPRCIRCWLGDSGVESAQYCSKSRHE